MLYTVEELLVEPDVSAGAWLREMLAIPGIVAILVAGYAQAQSPAQTQTQLQPAGGQRWTPPSSQQKSGEIGVSAHTNVEVFIPKGAGGSSLQPPSNNAEPQGRSSLPCRFRQLGRGNTTATPLRAVGMSQRRGASLRGTHD